MNKLLSGAKSLFLYLFTERRVVVAAVMERGGLILIAKRKLSDRFGGKWEFPGGKLAPGETETECLKREMKEEFDIEVEPGELLSESVFRYYGVPIKLAAYKTKYLSGEITMAEHDEVKWVAPEDLSKFDFVEADKIIIERILSISRAK